LLLLIPEPYCFDGFCSHLHRASHQ
jgi:hypothetical protein